MEHYLNPHVRIKIYSSICAPKDFNFHTVKETNFIVIKL